MSLTNVSCRLSGIVWITSISFTSKAAKLLHNYALISRWLWQQLCRAKTKLCRTFLPVYCQLLFLHVRSEWERMLLAAKCVKFYSNRCSGQHLGAVKWVAEPTWQGKQAKPQMQRSSDSWRAPWQYSGLWTVSPCCSIAGINCESHFVLWLSPVVHSHYNLW